MRKKTHSEFIAEVELLVGEEYTVLSDYNGSKGDVLFRHNSESCNYYEYTAKPNHFLRGRRCRLCSYTQRHDNMRKKHEDFVKEVYNLVGNDYVVLGEYKSAISSIKMKHVSCGHEWNPRACEFVNSEKRCPNCFGNNKKTTEQFKAEIYGVVGDEYTVMGEYVNIHEKITMRHNSSFCNNNEWRVEANSFLHNNRRCPACNESKGERRVREYLQSKGIEFIREYTFKDLKGLDGGLLRFDFAIIEKDTLKMVVEYDGEFHSKKVYIEHDLEKQKLYDSIKNSYCIEKDIPLLRINYTEFDKIESILEESLKTEKRYYYEQSIYFR
jgi:hypothetical protein